MYREIMRDKNLTVEAKAIYAYLCSFAGSGTECFPSVDLMTIELRMSKDRLYKHLNALVNAGIIEKSQSRNGNRWGKTVYTIRHKSGCVNTNFAYTENTYTENTVVEKSVYEIQDTNNNSTNSNSLKNKKYYDLLYSAYPRKGTAKEKESSFYFFTRTLDNSGYSFEQLYAAVKAFEQDINKTYPDKRSIPGISQFLTKRMYEKYVKQNETKRRF